MVVLAVGLIDSAVSTSLVFIGLTILGPLIASIAASQAQTAVVAACAVVVSVALGEANDIFLTGDHLVRISVVVAASSVAVWGAGQRMQRDAAMARIVRVAEVAQQAILRPPPPLLGPIAFAARYVSAAENALIGGDLYETAYTPHGVRLLVGDVQGKGLDAVRLAATVMGCFREVVFASPTLTELARELDERVAAQADDEQFVTAILIEFADDELVHIVNCGHHPPLRVGTVTLDRLGGETTELPLGLGPVPEIETYRFMVGERLLVYTDGLVEARGAGGEFFVLEDANAALREPELPLAVDALLELVLQHVGGHLDDDLAVVLAERR